jgi:hypothetical protein
MGVERALPAIRADVELGFVNNGGDNFNNTGWCKKKYTRLI